MISTVTLVIDTALFMLIWLVQIIVYPSFRYMVEEQLKTWHNRYKTRITFFVLPLMFGQVVAYLYALVDDFNYYLLLGYIMVIIAVVVTFFKEVPLHEKLAKGIDTQHSIEALIDWNWPRTIAWSIVFVLNLMLTRTF